MRPHLVAIICLALVALVMFVAGRATAPGRAALRAAEAVGVVVLHDPANAVTCWRVAGAAALSCLPDRWLSAPSVDLDPAVQRLVGNWEPAE